MIDDIARKRVEKLTERGIDLFEKGKYQEALQVAGELESAKGNYSFMLAAQSYAAMNDMKRAAAEMRRGVLRAPHIWLHWYYFGIYQGNLDKHQSALAAFDQALLCPTVDIDLVRATRADFLVRCGEYASALTFLEDISKPSLRWYAEGTRIRALAGLGRVVEAAEMAENFLRAEAEGDAEYGNRVGEVAATLARIRRGQGWSAEQTRTFLMQGLQEHGCSKEILSEIRNLDLRCHKEAKRIQIVVGATLPVGHPWRREAGGYGVLYYVVAVSVAEALTMIHDFESHVGIEDLEVLDSKVSEERTDEPLGVYWFTERCF